MTNHPANLGPQGQSCRILCNADESTMEHHGELSAAVFPLEGRPRKAAREVAVSNASPIELHSSDPTPRPGFFFVLRPFFQPPTPLRWLTPSVL